MTQASGFICSGNEPGDIQGTNTVTVNPNLVISSPPVNQTNCPSTSFTFSVGASGLGLAYQWYKAGLLLSAQTNSALVLTNIGSSDATNYAVVVSSICGPTVSNNVLLALYQPVQITYSPISVSTCLGSTATFVAGATGTGLPGLTYQWDHDRSVIPGQSAATLTLNNVSTNDSGNYRVVVTGTCNSKTNSASLTVLLPPQRPGFVGDMTNCTETPNPPLTVSVPNGITVDWFAKITGGAALARGTPSITPTNNAINATGYVYYAEARDLVTGCISSNRTPVTLYVMPCPLLTNLSNRWLTLSWSGNLDLQTRSSIDAGSWVTIITNSFNAQTNWSTLVTNSQQYFRLYVPGSELSVTDILSVRIIGTSLAFDWVGNRILQSTPSLTTLPSPVWTTLPIL